MHGGPGVRGAIFSRSTRAPGPRHPDYTRGRAPRAHRKCAKSRSPSPRPRARWRARFRVPASAARQRPSGLQLHASAFTSHSSRVWDLLGCPRSSRAVRPAVKRFHSLTRDASTHAPHGTRHTPRAHTSSAPLPSLGRPLQALQEHQQPSTPCCCALRTHLRLATLHQAGDRAIHAPHAMPLSLCCYYQSTTTSCASYYTCATPWLPFAPVRRCLKGRRGWLVWWVEVASALACRASAPPLSAPSPSAPSPSAPSPSAHSPSAASLASSSAMASAKRTESVLAARIQRKTTHARMAAR